MPFSLSGPWVLILSATNPAKPLSLSSGSLLHLDCFSINSIYHMTPQINLSKYQFLQEVPLIKNLKWLPTNLESNPISSLLGFQDSPYLVLSYLTNSVSHSSLPYTFCSIFPASSMSMPQPPWDFVHDSPPTLHLSFIGYPQSLSSVVLPTFYLRAP